MAERDEYEKLMERVLARFPELTRDEIEAMVESKLREHPLLNKTGALLLIAEELGAFIAKEPPPEALKTMEYTKIVDLVPGLNNVSVRGVAYAVDKLSEVKGHRILKLKIGDGSGVIDVILWDERADEAWKLGIKPGDLIAILNGYTRESLDVGGVELHLGRGGSLARLEKEPGQPDAKSFYMELGEALERGDGTYDIHAVVLEVRELRKVDTKYGEASVREILLGDERSKAVLTAWREKAEELGRLKPGEKTYITSIRVRDGRLSLTGRSIIAFTESPTEETLRMVERRVPETLKALDVIERSAGYMIIATDGKALQRVLIPREPDLSTGEYFKPLNPAVEFRRGRMYIVAEDVEKISPREEIREPSLTLTLGEILSPGFHETRDVIVEGELYHKTPVIKVKTRYGEAEKIGFWLRDGEHNVQGVAWRQKAEELSKIPEGSRIRLKWVSVILNPYGEPEIHLEADSKIEVEGEGRS